MPQKYLDQFNELTIKLGGPKPIGFKNPFATQEAYVESRKEWASKNLCKVCRRVDESSLNCWA